MLGSIKPNQTIERRFFIDVKIDNLMENLSTNDKLILLQYAITKYENENLLIGKLETVLEKKEIDRCIATLIGTQKVRRIGPDSLQNNISHTGELPEIPPQIKQIIDDL